LAERLSGKYEVTVFQGKPINKKTVYKIVSPDALYFNEKRSENRFLKYLFVDYASLAVLKFNILILKRLLSGNFDIIIPTDGGWEPAIVRILTWIKRKKMVIVGHAGIGWDDANNMWSFPDCFVALSEYAKSWARRVNPFIRIEYIPDGVNLDLFNPREPKINLTLRRPIALAVSALEKGKRIDLIIKAVSKIEGMSLLVCGRGEERDSLYKLGKELLGNRFDLMEFNLNDMPKVYRSCDIFLSASLPYYSFEMVLLEAMASGLPVVANNDPVREEIVGKAGLLADVSNTEEFANKIKHVALSGYGKLPLIQAMKFSWDEISERYMTLFNKLETH